MLELVGFLANLKLNIPALGVKYNLMGSFLVSSVGAFKVDCGYAPLCRKKVF